MVGFVTYQKPQRKAFFKHERHKYADVFVRLGLTKRSFANFVLSTHFQFKHRLDGYQNIDVGVIFRYQDRDNYYRYSTYSGKKLDPGKALFEQDLGGIWKLEKSSEECRSLSYLMKPFESYRVYKLKIVGIENRFAVYIDNLKCLEWTDPDPNYHNRGRLGFRVVSGLVEFYNLVIYEL